MENKLLSNPAPVSRIKVGVIKKYIPVVDKKTGKRKKIPVFYSYLKDVIYDIDGWADAKKFLPEDFDLVYMRLKRKRKIPGWINGLSWHGSRLRPNDEVLFWKRKEEDL